MTRCKWCGKRRLFLRILPSGLCTKCAPAVISSVKSQAKIIGDCVRIIKNSTDKTTKLKRCDLLLDAARTLRDFEEKGIPTIRPNPREYVKTYLETKQELLEE